MTVMEAEPGTKLTAEQAAMVEANLPLVEWTIRRYYPKKLEQEMPDAIADGMFGLIRAVQKFDPAKAKFSTYAVQWIRASVQQGVARFEGIGYRQLTGFSTGVATGEWSRPTSLDRPLGEDGGATMGDTIADDRVDVEGRALSSAYAEQMQAALIRACKDPLDLAVAEAMTTGERDVEVERRTGAGRGVVKLRRGRLVAKVRHPTYGLVARIPQAKEQPVSIIDSPPPIESTNGHHASTEHVCDVCGKPAASDQGVKVHKARAHGKNWSGKPKEETRPTVHAPSPVKERPKLDSTTIKAELYEDGYDPYAVIVGNVEDDQPTARTVILSTKADAQQVASLLATLGHKAWSVRLADAAVSFDGPATQAAP